MASIEDLKAVVTAKGGLARPNQFLVELPNFGDTYAVSYTHLTLPTSDLV